MIDFIQVDGRYCWEPLCGSDNAIYITLDGNRKNRIIRDPQEIEAREWIAVALVDMRGHRCVVFFDDTMPAHLVARVIIRQIDLLDRTYTISGITTIEGEV